MQQHHELAAKIARMKAVAVLVLLGFAASAGAVGKQTHSALIKLIFNIDFRAFGQGQRPARPSKSASRIPRVMDAYSCGHIICSHAFHVLQPKSSSMHILSRPSACKDTVVLDIHGILELTLLSVGGRSLQSSDLLSEAQSILGQAAGSVEAGLRSLVDGLFGPDNTFATQIPSDIGNLCKQNSALDLFKESLSFHSRMHFVTQRKNYAQCGLVSENNHVCTCAHHSLAHNLSLGLVFRPCSAFHTLSMGYGCV